MLRLFSLELLLLSRSSGTLSSISEME
ncbi:MAG: hypothetical protein QOF48_1277, partial [Verrucomicrobiota bacterium]